MKEVLKHAGAFHSQHRVQLFVSNVFDPAQAQAGALRIATLATVMSDEYAAWLLFAGNDPGGDSEWDVNGGIGILPARSSGQNKTSSPRENAIRW